MDLKEKFKNALKEAGLDESLVDSYKIKKESDIEATVEKVKKEQELLNTLDKAGLKDTFENYLQSHSDRQVSKALDTREKKMRDELRTELLKELKGDDKNPDGNDDNDNDNNPDENDNDNMTNLKTELQNMLDERFQKIMPVLDSFKEQRKEQDVQKVLKEKGLPDRFAPYIKSETPDEITKEVDELKSTFDEAAQEKIDQSIKDGLFVPKSGTQGGSVDEQQIANYAESKFKKDNKQFTGVKLEGINK